MRELNFEIGKRPEILKDCTDTRWRDRTIYNHFEGPLAFMDTVLNYKDHTYSKSSKTQQELKAGIEAYKKIGDFNTKFDKIYADVAEKVKDKLLARGFTTKMLYADVGFTSEKTGVMSKQRVMLGKRDCYFTNPSMGDGKLFHDIYINLSYSWGISNSVIRQNAYALYALTRALAQVLPMRVIVVNHVGTDIPTCYSYVLKQFGQPINPEQFLFFTSDSKRTFGWATYEILNKGKNRDSTVGQPTNTVSIASFNLDREIEQLFQKVKQLKPELFRKI